MFVLKVVGGLVQSSGWPSVVAVVGNWFGKGKFPLKEMRRKAKKVFSAYLKVLGFLCFTLTYMALVTQNQRAAYVRYGGMFIVFL